MPLWLECYQNLSNGKTMKKIIFIILSSIAIYVFFNFTGFVNNVYATLDCPAGGCPGCSYKCDCSPCAAQDGNYCPDAAQSQCPICVDPTCDSGWSEGGCPASCGKYCDEDTTTCSCGNPGGSITCHKCHQPPPTSTPTPPKETETPPPDICITPCPPNTPTPGVCITPGGPSVTMGPPGYCPETPTPIPPTATPRPCERTRLRPRHEAIAASPCRRTYRPA